MIASRSVETIINLLQKDCAIALQIKGNRSLAHIVHNKDGR